MCSHVVSSPSRAISQESEGAEINETESPTTECMSNTARQLPNARVTFSSAMFNQRAGRKHLVNHKLRILFFISTAAAAAASSASYTQQREPHITFEHTGGQYRPARARKRQRALGCLSGAARWLEVLGQTRIKQHDGHYACVTGGGRGRVSCIERRWNARPSSISRDEKSV